jgi:TatD DNase family protein
MAQAHPEARRTPPGIDAHAHLDDPVFDPDREEALRRARASGVGSVVLAAGDPRCWARVRAVARAHRLPFALGIHPWWPDPSHLDALPAALAGACAIGETGLDHHRARDDAERATQRALLDAHLELALASDRPVVLHHVHATGEVLDAVRQAGPVRGMLHAFVRGDLDRTLALGLYVSFGTDLARSRRAREAAARVPLDRLLLESDAPDRPLEGPRGEPAHLARLATIVAEARDLDPDEVLATSGANARRLFGLGEPDAP